MDKQSFLAELHATHEPISRAVEALADEAWAEVESLLKTTQPNNYKRAVQVLRDLQELALMESLTEEWHRRVLQFREQYSRKYSLMNLFDKSNFPRT